MKPIPTIAATLLVSVACSSCQRKVAEQAEPANVAAPSPSPSVPDPLARLRALPGGARDATLFRAISDAGLSCAKVTSSAYQQDVKGMAMFVARCPTGAPWAVLVSPSGYAQVRTCATATSVGLPACRAIDAAAHD